MKKEEGAIKDRILTAIALIISISSFITILALTIQYIGVDTTNKATIISGILSMLGGVVGAFSAYLIARAQLTRQLDIQDQKDRSRVLLEIKLKKAEEVLNVMTRTKMSFFKLQGTWTSTLTDHLNHIANHLYEEINYVEFANRDLIDQIDENRDEFIYTFSEIYQYRPYFTPLISKIEVVHNEYFKKLTLDINDVMVLFLGSEAKFTNYKYLLDFSKEKIDDINRNFERILDIIDEDITDTEKILNQLVQDFERK